MIDEETKQEGYARISASRAKRQQLDQISLALGVSRRCINRWSKQIGMSATRKRNVGQSVRVFIDEPNAGVVEFLTMKLPCSVSGEAGYY